MRVLRWPLLLLWVGWIATVGSEPVVALCRDRDWQKLPIDEPVLRIDTPASGALFARTKAGLLRSNDGGLTWSDIPLPAPRDRGSEAEAVMVDPIDHTVLYAEGADGLYQSTVEPVSWNLILPLAAPIDSIVVSPADSAIIYVAAKQEHDRGPIVLWRTDDRGATWAADATRQIIMDTSSRTEWITLAAHATNPDRLVESWTGGGGRNYLSVPVRLSQDRGETNQRLPLPAELALTPTEVLDGTPGNPARMYLLERPYMTERGILGRSDDSGQTWQTLYRSPDEAMPIRLAVDGSNPDRIFLGHRITTGTTVPELAQSPIIISTDAGVTWAPVGIGISGQFHYLALGVDGAWLFAATSEGLWRHPLGSLDGR
ncbi:MAG: WD40/YVTN/BNR-like repeat-containing protein [Chloroflexota bacterium]